MEEHALFVTTELFEATTPGDHFINPRCFGEDFAKWLRQKLEAQRIESCEPIQEDWGWVLLLKHQAHTFTVSIGVMDGSIGEVPAEWRVGLSYEKPLNGVRAWFKGPPHELLLNLFSQLRNVLASEPRFRLSSEQST